MNRTLRCAVVFVTVSAGSSVVAGENIRFGSTACSTTDSQPIVDTLSFDLSGDEPSGDISFGISYEIKLGKDKYNNRITRGSCDELYNLSLISQRLSIEKQQLELERLRQSIRNAERDLANTEAVEQAESDW